MNHIPRPFVFASVCTLDDVRREPMLAEIIRHVCAANDVGLIALKSHSRLPPLVHARAVYCWIARKHTAKTYAQIGMVVGGRNHSTIVNAINRVRDNMAVFEDEIRKVESLMGVA